MPDRWIRTTETTDDIGGTTPDLKGYDVDGFAGNKRHPEGSPIWVVRVYADDATLDALVAEPQVSELSDGQVENALNNMSATGAARSATEWNQAFRIGGD